MLTAESSAIKIMCGRYTAVTKVKAIEKRFNVSSARPELFVPNTNISHGELAPVITNEKPGELQFFQFGFTPFWAKKQFYTINARAEGDSNKSDDPGYTGSMGIINKPMFRKAIRSQRCLVVADCFIEGPKKERLNKPYVVYLQNGERPFAMAGIWDEWVNTATGEITHSFAVITTVANNLMHQIQHHRSPVILSKENEQAWLDSSLELGEVTDMLKPYPAHLMNAYPISADIKSPKANGIELLQPVGERVYKEYDFEIYESFKLQGMGHTTARVRKNQEEEPPNRAGEQGSLFD